MYPVNATLFGAFTHATNSVYACVQLCFSVISASLPSAHVLLSLSPRLPLLASLFGRRCLAVPTPDHEPCTDPGEVNASRSFSLGVETRRLRVPIIPGRGKSWTVCPHSVKVAPYSKKNVSFRGIFFELGVVDAPSDG